VVSAPPEPDLSSPVSADMAEPLEPGAGLHLPVGRIRHYRGVCLKRIGMLAAMVAAASRGCYRESQSSESVFDGIFHAECFNVCKCLNTSLIHIQIQLLCHRPLKLSNIYPILQVDSGGFLSPLSYKTDDFPVQKKIVDNIGLQFSIKRIK
jgi:hypothetical protein